ncbi:MAG: protein PilO [Deltaproteobacteria bacterium HGW-Deltaproteobacteria-21]|jgi:type IV pilus assembly protein PilO|nr:MAG: protein PilO [Deltaproteobacteria bacterium HGW-Deltaproteobacteria-21]
MDLGPVFEKIEKIKMPFRIVILAGTVILLGGLFAWFYYIPKSEEIVKTRNEIAALEQKLTKAKITARRLAQFEAEWAQVDTQFKDALKLLPNTKEIPTLLKTITQLGSDSELEFRLFSPQREKMQDFYVEIPVSIEVKGNYHHVAVFFDKVGAMERIVNILNVSMAPDAARSTTLNTRCDAVTYRFKGESDGAPPK